MATIDVKALFIIALGETRDSPTDMRIIVEDNVMVMPSLVTAIHFRFASYYVFNISFPTEFRLILLFFERFVYGLKTSVPKLLLSIVNFHDNLERIN